MDKVTFKVRPSMKQKFNTIVRKLDRCLKAGGFGGFQPRLVGECDIHVNVFTDDSRKCHYVVKGEEYEADLPVDVAKLGDYRLIGEYRRVDDGRWMKIMHSDDVKDQYEVSEENMRCDHCGRNIRNRNGYYYLRDKGGNLIVVGSTCVDEFLGMNIRGLLDALGDMGVFMHEPGEIDFEKEVICVGMRTFVNIVDEMTNGFVKWHKKGEEHETAEGIKETMMDVVTGKRAPLDTLSDIEVKAIVESAREYWNGKVAFDEFTVNSRKSIEEDYVSIQWSGIAGFAIFKVKRNAVKEAAMPATTGNGSFIGNEGDRISRALIPGRMYQYENQWGVGYAIHLSDHSGNHYLTFTSSSDAIRRARENFGKEIQAAFTVKCHKTDRGMNVNHIKCLKFA